MHPSRRFSPRRPSHVALAFGAVGVLVAAPSAAAVADDVPPPEVPDAAQPQTPELVLPTDQPADQVTPAPEETTPSPEVTTPAPEETTPSPEVTTPAPEVTTPAPGVAPVPDEAPAQDSLPSDPPADAPPVDGPPADDPPPLDPTPLAAPLLAGMATLGSDVDEAPPIVAYAGSGKVDVTVQVDGALEGESFEGVLRVERTLDGSMTVTNPAWYSSYASTVSQAAEESLVISVATAPPGVWAIAGEEVSVPVCEVPDVAPPAECRPSVVLHTERATRVLTATARDGADNPVADADVDLYRLDPEGVLDPVLVASATSDAAGRVDFGSVPSGYSYRLRTSVPPPYGGAGDVELDVDHAPSAVAAAATPIDAQITVLVFGDRLVTPRVVASPASGADMNATLRAVLTYADGPPPLPLPHVSTGIDGYPVPAGTTIAQPAGASVTLEIVTPPGGYLGQEPVVVPPCLVLTVGASCAPTTATITVVPTYRTLRVAVDGVGVPAGGVAFLLELIRPGFDDWSYGIQHTGSDGAWEQQMLPGTYRMTVTDAELPFVATGSTTTLSAPPVVTVAQANTPAVATLTVSRYATRAVVPTIVATPPEVPAPHLLGQIEVERIPQTGSPVTSTYPTDATGAIPVWLQPEQSMGDTVVVRLAHAPFGFAPSGPTEQTVPPCILDGVSVCPAVPVTFEVARADRDVEVVVTDGASPVPGVPVELYAPVPADAPPATSPALVASGTTGDDGTFAAPASLPVGRGYTLVIPTVPERAVAVDPISVEVLPAAAGDPAPQEVTVDLDYLAYRAVNVHVLPGPVDPGTDLSAEFSVEVDDGSGVPEVFLVETSADGSAAGPQNAGETLTFTLTTPPTGFMIPPDPPVVLPPCVVELATDVCEDADVALFTVAAYRRLIVVATSGSTHVEGVEITLLAPGADGPAGADPPTTVGTDVTDSEGGIDFGLVDPGTYLAVVTDTPAGFATPDMQLVEIPAVPTVTQADDDAVVAEIELPAYGDREIFPSVVPAAAESPDPDLSATIRLDHDGGETEPWSETLTIDTDGWFEGGYVTQSNGETLTFTLVDVPDGFMLPAEPSQTVAPCVVPEPGMECPDLDLTFEVTREYRRVTLQAVTADGVDLPGVLLELHGPAAPAPTPSPTPTPTSTPTATATASAVPVAYAPAAAPAGLLLVGRGTTGGGGLWAVPALVRPAAGYAVVVTGVPDGYLLPTAPVTVDVAAVGSVPEADQPLVVTVRIARAAPTAEPTGLSATGVDVAPLALAAAALLLGGLCLIGLRRRSART